MEVIEQPEVEAGLFLADFPIEDLPAGTTEMNLYFYNRVSPTFFNKKVGGEAAQLIFRDTSKDPVRVFNYANREPDETYDKFGTLVSLVDDRGIEMLNSRRVNNVLPETTNGVFTYFLINRKVIIP